VEEDVGRRGVSKVVAKNLERSDEGPSVRMQLTGCHVQLGEEILLEEGERKSEAQPLEDGRVDEGEGHPIGCPIIHAYWHASRGDAQAQV